MSARFVFVAVASYVSVMIADRFAGLLTVPVTTRVFSVAEYGAVLFLTNIASLAIFLIGVNFATTLALLVAEAESEAEKRSIAMTTFVLQTAAFAAVYLALAGAAPFIASHIFLDGALSQAVVIAAVGSFLFSTSQALAGAARALEMHEIYRRVQLPATIVQTALVILLLLQTTAGIAAIYLAMIVAGAWTLPAYLYCLRRQLFGTVSFATARRAVRGAVPLIPGQAAVFLTTNSAAFFLARYASLEETGLFAVANSVAATVLLLTFSFDGAWTPYVLMRKDEPEIDRVLVRIFSLYSTMLLLAASGVALFAHEVFLVLVGASFHEAYRLVPFLVFAYCIFSFAYCFAQGILIGRRNIHYSSIGIVVAGLFMLICPVLTAAYGAMGVVASMAAAFFVMLVLLQVVGQSLYPIPYPWFRHAAVWLVSTAMVMSAAFLDVGVWSFVIKIGILVVIAALVLVTRAITAEDLKASSALLWKLWGPRATA